MDKKSGNQIRAESGKLLSPSQPIITQLAEYPERMFLEDEAATAFLHNLMLFRFFDFEMPALRKPSVAGVTHLGDRGHNLSSVLQSLCEDEETRVAILRWLRELTPSDVNDLAFPTVDLADRIQVALKEKKGHLISAESASDGTIRFLAFLAVMFGPDNGKSLFIEEIENGIHPNRIDLLVRLAQQVVEDSKTQILATTHSPASLTYLREKTLGDAIVITRSKRGSVARRFADLQLPEHDKIRVGELLQDGWFEVEADHLEAEKRKGGKE
jgi:predicted ATPase